MSSKPLTPGDLVQLDRVAAISDDQIDIIDIPEAPEQNWTQAHRGAYSGPGEEPVAIRLDRDVVAWFKEHTVEGRYQTEINRVLRRHVEDVEKKSA